MTKVTASQITGYAFAALFWALGAVCILPVLIMAAGVFWQDGQPSLAYVAAAFSDSARVLELLSNSLVLTAGTVCISLLLGVPVGFLCFRTDLPLRRWIIIGCFLAACIPVYVTATSWMALFGMQFWLYSPLGASWINGIAYAPLAALITGACFALADRDIEDTAALDTGRRGIFWHTSLPMASWGIGLAGVAVAVLSVWDITVTDILMVRTFAEEVFTQFQLGAGPWTAAAVSLPMVVLICGLCAAVSYSLGRYDQASLSGALRRPGIIGLGRARYAALFLVTLGVAVFFFVPAAALVRSVASLDNLVTAWRASEYELAGTLKVTPVAASICAVMATVIAWAMVRVRHCRLAGCVCLLLLISVPAPVVGIGLIELLNRPGLSGMIYDSQAGLVLAYVIRALPFGVLAMLPAVKRIPEELEHAVALDGGNWVRKITSVVVPLSWQAVMIAWFMAFVVSMSEMGASFLVVPPGRATLSIRFFTLIHYGVYPDAAGICLILLLIVGVAAAAMAALLRPFVQRRLL